MSLRQDIYDYQPINEQEKADREVMLHFMAEHPDYLERSNKIAHFTASIWTVNEEYTRTLMVYHNIYDSWSWIGGHADGEEDLRSVALRELQEETGYSCSRLELLNSIYTTVAFCNEKIDIYLARELREGSQHLDEDEFIRVEAYSVEELLEKIFRCEIQDSKTVCGILTYAAKFCHSA